MSLKESTCNNSSTEARAFTSFTKHLLTKSTKSDDHCEDVSVGGESRQIRFVIYLSLSSHTADLVGVHPNKGMPALRHLNHAHSKRPHVALQHSYTSGPMYQEVPHTVSRFEQECSSWIAKPKSPSLITPFSEMRRLSGLMSYPVTEWNPRTTRWRMLRL